MRRMTVVLSITSEHLSDIKGIEFVGDSYFKHGVVKAVHILARESCYAKPYYAFTLSAIFSNFVFLQKLTIQLSFSCQFFQYIH